MNIQDILSSEQSEYISSLTRKNNTEKDEESSGSSLPISWGSDTVSISKEARAAQQSASTSDQNEEAESEEEEGDAAGAFGAYMAKSRGAASSDSTDKLEALQSKLQQLQAKKSQVLSADGVSEGAKTAQASGIDAQINQIMSEIAEMQAQAAAA